MVAANLAPYANLFFFPGVARSRICRQSAKYDPIVPSTLFLAHFLPDGPPRSQRNALASLALGGNGIWGDLASLEEADMAFWTEMIKKYKKVAESATLSYPIAKGYIGSSPEVYEKINEEDGKGFVAFFTKEKGVFTHVTRKLARGTVSVDGANAVEELEGGRVKVTVELDADDARLVFFN
jgi:hypothetical protein